MYAENYKVLVKEIREDLNVNWEAYHAQGLQRKSKTLQGESRYLETKQVRRQWSHIF